jgi:universal stress protein A
MSAYRQILAAIDLEEGAEEVMARAGALAIEHQAEVSALHVISHRGAGVRESAHLASLEELEVQGLTRAQTDRLLGLMDRFRARPLVAYGRPSQAVRDTVQQLGVDLLVMGSHTPRGVPGLVGSTAERVAHGVSCDVLVVRHGRGLLADGSLAPYRRVLCAADLSEHCATVAGHARRWADAYGAELILVHVEEYFPADRSNQLIAPEDRDPEEDLRLRSAGSLSQLVGEACAQGVEPEIILSDRSVKQEIVEFAREREVDLILIGSHGARGTADLLGSTADGVLHRAPCDLLLVRVGDKE